MLRHADSCMGLFTKKQEDTQLLDAKEYETGRSLMLKVIEACNEYINDYAVFSYAHADEANEAVRFCNRLHSDYQSSTHPNKGFIFYRVLQNFLIVLDRYCIQQACIKNKSEFSRLKTKWLDPVFISFALGIDSNTRKMLEENYRDTLKECKFVDINNEGQKVLNQDLLETLRQGVEVELQRDNALKTFRFSRIG